MTVPRGVRVGNVRWGIGALLGVGVIVNYFDRVNISVATAPMSKTFHLGLGEFGIVISAFSWSYLLAQIPVGTLLDRVGVKWLQRIGTFLWGLASLLTAVAGGLGIVLLSRVLLGIAECPAFPGASKATGYWFPLSERARATSLFDGAAKCSNVIGLPAVAAVMGAWGWRAGFVFTALLSFAFGIVWWWLYRDRDEHPRLGAAERAYIVAGGAQQLGPPPGGVLRGLGYALRQRKVWALTLGFACYSYGFTLLSSWLPGYLQTEMHMSVLGSGLYSIGPWLVATLADVLIGGWLLDWVISRGHDQSRVRKIFLVCGFACGLAIGFAALTRDVNVAIVCIAVSLGGLAVAAPIGWSLPAIVAPQGAVGAVGGFMNFVNSLTGVVVTILTGFIAQATHSFAGPFVLAAAVLAFGIVFYTVGLGRIEQLPPATALAEEAASA
ncbi:MAG: MFS transporter [Candidatus Dormiibacterota bacterium]